MKSRPMSVQTHNVFVVRLSPPESWTCYSSHLQLCSLFRSHDFQRRHHQPAAFVILDVGTDLPSHSRVSVAVQVVVLKVNARGAITTNGEQGEDH